jgi:hypothetical protein
LEYGEKPDRMDGGFREKKMVEGIKNAIKVTRIRKRLFHHTNTGNTVQYMVYNTPLPEVSLQADNITEQSPVESIALECMDSWSSEFSFVPEPMQHRQSTLPGQPAGTTLDSDCEINLPEFNENLGLQSFDFKYDLNSNAYLLDPPLGTEYSQHTQTQSSCSFDAASDLNLFPSIPSTPLPFEQNSDFEKAILLVHYIDHVLYIQFPFYNEALSHERRSWLLSLITTVKPICKCISIATNFKAPILGRNISITDLTP